MEDKTEDTDGARGLEETTRLQEVLDEEQTSGRPGRSRKTNETPSEPTTTVSDEGLTTLEKAPAERPAVVEGQVMGRLTIRELEMMPKMAELGKLDEIPVGGTTNIEPEVIGAVAGVAAQSIEGVASLGTPSLRRAVRERIGGAERRARGIEVEVGRREVILDVNLRIIYGYSIPATVVKVREMVADRLLRFCGLVAKEINIRVTGVEFPERMPGRVQ